MINGFLLLEMNQKDKEKMWLNLLFFSCALVTVLLLQVLAVSSRFCNAYWWIFWCSINTVSTSVCIHVHVEREREEVTITPMRVYVLCKDIFSIQVFSPNYKLFIPCRSPQPCSHNFYIFTKTCDSIFAGSLDLKFSLQICPIVQVLLW